MENALEYIKESNYIEGIYSEKEHNQSLKAWDWLTKRNKLDKKTILGLHYKITKNQLVGADCGNYRQCNVQVGGRICPNHTLVSGLMREWIDTYGDKALYPIQAHIEFEHIHPFIDGNGRTGRMLLWWHQERLGQEPTLFKDIEKHAVYYKLF